MHAYATPQQLKQSILRSIKMQQSFFLSYPKNRFLMRILQISKRHSSQTVHPTKKRFLQKVMPSRNSSQKITILAHENPQGGFKRLSKLDFCNILQFSKRSSSQTVHPTLKKRIQKVIFSWPSSQTIMSLDHESPFRGFSKSAKVENFILKLRDYGLAKDEDNLWELSRAWELEERK